MNIYFSPSRHHSTCVDSNEISVLLSCICLHFGTVTAEEVSELLKLEINWDRFLQIAIAYSVMPLLYQSLQALPSSSVPRSLRTQLQLHYRMNGLYSFSQTKELLKLLAGLREKGIDAIPFKGPILAASVYGNVALRQFSDLDILVRRQDFWQAKAVFVAQGYESPVPQSSERQMFRQVLQICLWHQDSEAALLNQHFQPSLMHCDQERRIDLHWGIPPKRFWKTHRFERLWQNLSTIELMGQSVQTFSPEATLVVQCMNVAKTPRDRSLKQICDVAQIIQTAPDLNWETALDLSSWLRCHRLFLLGLSITHQVLGITLPKVVLEKINRLLANHPSMELLQEQIFSPQAVALPWLQGVWLNYRYHLGILDQPWDFLCVTSQYLQILFDRVLLPNEKDHEIVSLPIYLSFLYYFLHPIRLLLKRLPFSSSAS